MQASASVPGSRVAHSAQLLAKGETEAHGTRAVPKGHPLESVGLSFSSDLVVSVPTGQTMGETREEVKSIGEGSPGGSTAVISWEGLCRKGLEEVEEAET